MNVFYAGALLTLVSSVMTLKIDKFYSCIPSERSSNQIAAVFLFTWFKVEGQVVDRWERPTSTN